MRLITVLLAAAMAIVATRSDPTSFRRPEASLPNIVLIVTDDQGYADVGAFGAKGFDTPNLDRLAQDGRQKIRVELTPYTNRSSARRSPRSAASRSPSSSGATSSSTVRPSPTAASPPRKRSEAISSRRSSVLRARDSAPRPSSSAGAKSVRASWTARRS